MLITRTDMTPLSSALRGRLITPGSPAWDGARQAWNLAVDQRPAAVAFAAGVDDVVAVVDFARAEGLRVAAQGTGHGAATLGELDDTVLLKTIGMGAVEIDAPAHRARVGAGALWGDVAVLAGKAGLAALHGSSPDVGVVGYTLGGGIGWLTRAHGLACNSVAAIELVDAEGRAMRVDHDHEPELFWALRGGGGSFGVVTAVELELVPLPEVYAGTLMWPAEEGAELLHLYRDWASRLPRELTSIFRFLHLPPIPEVPEPLRGRRVVTLGAAYLGGEEQGAELLAPMRKAGTPLADSLATMPAADLARLHGDPEHPSPGIGHHLLLDELSAGAADTFAELAGPDSGSPLVSVELRHLGGAAASAPAGAGALGRIEGEFAMYAVGAPMRPGDRESIEAHLERMAEALSPYSSGREYLNFADQPSPARLAFEPSTWARLTAAKRLYDPENRFRSNHPVPAAPDPR